MGLKKSETSEIFLKKAPKTPTTTKTLHGCIYPLFKIVKYNRINIMVYKFLNYIKEIKLISIFDFIFSEFKICVLGYGQKVRRG